MDPSDWYKEITFSVSGLEPCAEYRFSIRAITEIGTEGPEAALSAQSPFESSLLSHGKQSFEKK